MWLLKPYYFTQFFSLVLSQFCGAFARQIFTLVCSELTESLSLTYMANGRFKLRISQSRKRAAKNSWQQFLWRIKKMCETNTLDVEIMNSKRHLKRKLGHVVQIRVCRWRKSDANANCIYGFTRLAWPFKVYLFAVNFGFVYRLTCPMLKLDCGVLEVSSTAWSFFINIS